MNPFWFLALIFNIFFDSKVAIPKMQFAINTTWDSQKVKHEPVKFKFSLNDENSLKIDIVAPFFNSPAKPNYKPGDNFNLWDYEVAEVFFLSDSGKYIELEFGPFGHYLVLLLNGTRNPVKIALPLNYTTEISNSQWSGTAIIPESYFPMKVTKFNAYAIHGEGDERQYESLFAVPSGKFPNPDFHRLDYFQALEFEKLMPKNWNRTSESDIWQKSLAEAKIN